MKIYNVISYNGLAILRTCDLDKLISFVHKSHFNKFSFISCRLTLIKLVVFIQRLDYFWSSLYHIYHINVCWNVTASCFIFLIAWVVLIFSRHHSSNKFGNLHGDIIYKSQRKKYYCKDCKCKLKSNLLDINIKTYILIHH